MAWPTSSYYTSIYLEGLGETTTTSVTTLALWTGIRTRDLPNTMQDYKPLERVVWYLCI
jgi:hypothetical protein